MDDEPSGPPSNEAETQRLEAVMPFIWIELGILAVLAFIGLLVAAGRPG